MARVFTVYYVMDGDEMLSYPGRTRHDGLR